MDSVVPPPNGSRPPPAPLDARVRRLELIVGEGTDDGLRGVVRKLGGGQAEQYSEHTDNARWRDAIDEWRLSVDLRLRDIALIAFVTACWSWAVGVGVFVLLLRGCT